MSRDPSSAPLPAAKFEVPTSETKELEIYFRDLSPETQKAVLALYGLESPKDTNWNSFPIFVIEVD